MVSSANSFTLNTDFNQSPYWDDYDDGKGYYRILYKPSMAVQARELTQSQTIIQKQIDRFAEHFFREGSLVSGGAFNIEIDVAYVKVNDTDNLGNPVNIDNFSRIEVTGATTGLKAYVIRVEDGAEGTADPKTLFVRYTASGNDPNITAFAAGETLTSTVGNLVVASTDPTGFGSIFTIDDGVVFAKDHFVKFERQQIVLSKYSQQPSCKVGFNILEDIVSFLDDSSLLDPASGSPNFAAPGADRLRLTAELTKVDLDDPVGPPDFAELFTIKNGIIQDIKERSQYSIIRDELAKRTYDESGDYYVNGLNVRIREHLDTGSNFGYLSAAEGGNNELLAIGVEPGTAYIKGYEVGTLVTTYLTTPKSTAYENINSQVVSARMGNYVVVNELVGDWNLNSGIEVELYDSAQQRISGKAWSTGSPTGSKIGTARLKAIEHVSGVFGDADTTYNIYLFDIKMETGAFSDVKSIYFDNATSADLFADIVLEDGIAVLHETGFNSLLYPTGSPFTRSIRDTQDLPDTTFTFSKTFNINISANGTFSIVSGVGDEIFPYATGELADAEKRQIFITLNEDANVSLVGTVATTNGSDAVTGTGTEFTKLNPGDKIEITGVSGTYFVKSITNDTSLTLTENVGDTVSGAAIAKVYKAGDLIDFTTKGYGAGDEKSINCTSATSLAFDMKENLDDAKTGTATLRLTRTSATEIKKQLKKKRYVKIDCSSAGTTGPFNLGFSDVIRVTKILKDSSAITSLNQGTDVTHLFTLDNGQRDEFYEHASIIPNGITLNPTDHLLVELDYFLPDYSQGVSFFSVDSYPIDDTSASNTTIMTHEIPQFRSPTTGAVYDLRDMLDFRPVKTNTANDATDIASASTNPTASTAFNAPSGGLRLLVPFTDIVFDYSFYLARKDIVVVDKDGNFKIVQGIPAILPITPKTPDNAMSLATIYVAPYPSMAPQYAREVGRLDLANSVRKTGYKRHTMRDIGVLKQRIENLEYYQSLSLLEKQALEMVIPDEDGLDRFKNGIFVDNFANHLLGATYNPDYRISIDRDEKVIRPIFKMDSLRYNYISGTNVQQTGNFITLPYTEELLLEQPHATTIRNVEATIYRFIGEMVISPPYDLWVDTQFAPDNHIDMTFDFEGGPLSTEWNSWQHYVTGYNIINAETGQIVYTTTDKKFAEEQAYKLAGKKQVKTNSIGYSGPNFATIVEEVIIATRTGSQVFQGSTDEQVELGNMVIDVGLVPYIRPQVLRLLGRGLKPNTRFYVFFDGEKMSDFVTPTNSNYQPTGSEGDPIISDVDGNVYCLLRLPANGKRFTFGTKKVVITDSPTNDDEAVTFCEGFFVAQGLVQQKQNTILSTTRIIQYTENVSESKTLTNTIFKKSKYPSCMAYSFTPRAPDGEEGIFLTSVDLFIESVHPTLGVWIEIREMDSAGGITGTMVPYSDVWLDPDQITTTPDSSTPTNFKFKVPIFLYNNVQYALVIHTVGINPDTYFWISRLGEEDVLTGQQVHSRALTGTLYTTNNNQNFDIIPNADLKVRFYRANFNTAVTGQAVFGNIPIENVNLASVSGALTHLGETFKSHDQLTLINISGTIDETDILVGANSGTIASVVYIDGSVYGTSNTGFIVGETVDVYYANAEAKSITAEISAIDNASGTLMKFSSGDLSAQFINTSGEFVANTILVGQTSGATAIVGSTGPMKYSVVDFEPAYLDFARTSCNFEMLSTSNTGVQQNWVSVVSNENKVFDTERIILSRTDETNGPSNQFRATLSSASPYVSPVIDIDRCHSVYIFNIVNDDITGEDAASGGNLINKYISKTVTLDEGQDAEDMVVQIVGYRPPGTEIHVWCKIRNAEDADTFASKPWIKLNNKGASVYSSKANPNDFIEYDFEIPLQHLTGPNEEVQYVNSAGVEFTGYKQFAIKIGLASNNSAVVPRCTDLRVIALQK